jgi:hypothetical protein
MMPQMHRMDAERLRVNSNSGGGVGQKDYSTALFSVSQWACHMARA